MFIRIISFLFLFCFTFSSVEARQAPASRHGALHASGAKKIERKKNAVKTNIRKKPTPWKKRKELTLSKRHQPVSKFRKQSQAVNAKQRRLRTGATVRKRKLHTATSRKKTSQPLTTRQRKLQIAKRKRRAHVSKRRIKYPVPVAPPLTYLSQLNTYSQENAESGGLHKLYAKKYFGQRQTVAVIELSGTWDEMNNVINKKKGSLPDKTRERYKRNFLPPIGGPRLHPNGKNSWIYQADGCPNHGSSVSSIVLDLAPQAKVLPVSTYYCPRSDQSYDVADALMKLSQNKAVNIINISSGYFNGNIEEKKIGKNPDGTDKYLFRDTFPQKYIDTITAVAKAKKVIVFAAGNEGKDAQGPEFIEITPSYTERFIGYLAENLDPETLKSVIFAGNFDPDTRTASIDSNKPGPWPAVQKRFLFAPGKHQTSYSGLIGDGTSNSAPYICAAIANLCAKKGVTPRRAAQALLDTADRRPQKAIYGSGIIRADKALDWIEKGY